MDYTTQKWRTKRKNILRRDKYCCQICKRFGRSRQATQVHHIKPADEYPEKAFDDENLISLCHACHNKQHPEKSKARKFRNYPPYP